MLGDRFEFFLMKFVIMRERKNDKQWDLLRKMQLVDSNKYYDKLKTKKK